MKRLKITLICTLILMISCYAKSEYNLHLNPKSPTISSKQDSQILFILDYSNSMSEILVEKTKYSLLLNSIKTILPQISNSKVGVRIYGHRWGLTPFDACKASTLIVPIENNNEYFITESLKKFKPRGMTPITYSLKQAVKNDFTADDKEKHIVLITDGGENCDESPCKYAMELVKYRQDIKIDVIALNLDNEEDLDQLKCTAVVTGGKLYSANTQAELVQNLQNAFNRSKRVNAKILLH